MKKTCVAELLKVLHESQNTQISKTCVAENCVLHNKNEQGITLIALIIAIILLIILAIVGIRGAYNSGIIDYAVNGTEGYIEAEGKEQNAISNADSVIKSVKNRTNGLTNIKPERLILSAETAKVYIGENYTLSAIVSPIDSKETSVTWTSSDENIATVSANGEILGKKKGSVTITARANGNNEVIAVCTVNVKERLTEEQINELRYI